MIKALAFDGTKTIDFTESCKSITWSGDLQSIARVVEIAAVFPCFDTNHQPATIIPGCIVYLYYDNKEFFRGVVFNRSINSNQEYTITVYDYLIYINKSDVTYNFQKTTAEDATKKICSELGVKVGNLITTRVQLDRLMQATKGYDAIMEMYSQASKVTGKQYVMIMIKDELSVIEKGSLAANYKINSYEHIISSNYNESIENVVNRVKIYNENNQLVGQVDDNVSRKLFGLIQLNYQVEQDKNPNTVANNMLHGLDLSLGLEVIGNINCITGYSLITNVKYLTTVQDVKLYIDADTHTFDLASGSYTMKLTLNFTNKMDLKE